VLCELTETWPLRREELFQGAPTGRAVDEAIEQLYEGGRFRKSTMRLIAWMRELARLSRAPDMAAGARRRRAPLG
jgi:hypothetical protein